MSRSLERGEHGFAAPALVTVLTVPAGHKYEVVGISWQGDLTHAQTAYIFVVTPAAGYVGRDQFNVVATTYAEYHGYQNWVMYEGDALAGWHAAAAGTAFMTFDYIDVDYST